MTACGESEQEGPEPPPPRNGEGVQAPVCRLELLQPLEA